MTTRREIFSNADPMRVHEALGMRMVDGRAVRDETAHSICKGLQLFARRGTFEYSAAMPSDYIIKQHYSALGIMVLAAFGMDYDTPGFTRILNSWLDEEIADDRHEDLLIKEMTKHVENYHRNIIDKS